jgi:hypothetical protein
LTLFAIVGLSFVLYAQAEAESSRLSKESFTLRQPLESPDRMWSFALSQLLYDSFDNGSGVYSGLRGHSLARSMYGFDNTIDANGNYVPNQTAFNGIGRNVLATDTTNPVGGTETQLVNYMHFWVDGQLHDPERLGWRTGYQGGAPGPLGPVTGGFNAPYTYPDLNNMYLAAINAGGQVLMPSMHRHWLFNPANQLNDATTPNWISGAGKYMTLRPRPVEQLTALQVAAWNATVPAPQQLPYPLSATALNALTPGPGGQQAALQTLIFQLQTQQNALGLSSQQNQLLPYPDDGGGDVKNLYWLPGPNDSVWVDLGYPVQVAPDGRKYKPLFAFFITDLDNRINLNVHGNMRGQTATPPAGYSPNAPFYHVSNQGWGKWEVNVGAVLNSQNPNAVSLNTSMTPPNPPTINGPEWLNLFMGVPNPGPGSFNQGTIRGRYGWNLVPDDPTTYGTGGNYASPGTTPHAYGQVDYDACTLAFGSTQQILLPGIGGYNPYNTFPAFQMGYDNGSGGPNNNAERVNHPLIYDFFRPFNVPAGSGLANPTPLAPDNRPGADDRAFPAFEMKALLNGGLIADPTAAGPYGTAPVMAANAMKSQLGTLLPFNFNDPLDIAGSLRRRSLVTTLSMEINQPGMSPWMWQNADGTGPDQMTNVASQIQTPLAGDDPVGSRAPRGNPSFFPDPNGKLTPRTGAIPTNSEFNVPSPATGAMAFPQSTWRAVTDGINSPLNANAAAAIKSFLGRLDLSRQLQPYPHQLDPTKIRFDDDTVLAADPQMRTVRNVYLAAQLDRQVMAQDIYRLLRKLCGVASVAPANQAAPTEVDLMPRRWLAQLAVNIVDFIDSDDISTPFNFYPDNEPVTAPTDAIVGSNPTPATSPVLIPATPTAPAVYETLKYWVFGTELPRVVLNEVFVEYNDPPAATATPPYTVNVNVWAELLCTMPNAVSATVDQTDANAVLLGVPAPQKTQAPYAPYRIVIADTVPTGTGGPLVSRQLAAPLTGFGNDNVLGTPDAIRHQTDDPADPTTTAFLGAYYTATLGQGTLTAGAAPVISIAPQTFLVVGPGANAKPAGPAPLGFSDQHLSATYTTLPTIPSQLPTNTVCVPSQAMSYQINVTKPGLVNVYNPPDLPNGTLTLLVRRLSNPRMPPSNNPLDPQFNPYVTIDYLHGIPLSNNNYKNGNGTYYWSYGKLQPYAADMNLDVPQGQTAAPPAAPPPPKTGETAHTLGQQNVWGQANAIVNPYLAANQPNPAYPAFDWLVHLDRALVSPIELLNVSFYHPHELTHRFVVPSTGAPITTAPFPAQWKYKHTGLGPWYDEIASAAPPVGTGTPFARTGAWFDQTTRLYRFLEFVEVFDRAYGMTSDGAYGSNPTYTVTVNGVPYNIPYNYGVSSIGRRPGRINLNTVWDQEILNALLDPQTQPNGPNYFSPADVLTMYQNLLNGRSSNYITAITNGMPLQALSASDRPFSSMASGTIPYTDPFYPNGVKTYFPFATGIGDTFLRPISFAYNNALSDANQQGQPALPRLFENPNALTQAGAGPPPAPPVYTSNAASPHLSNPYLRFEPLNKIYNNLTTRSNVFGVWCTMGYFEVIDDSSRPVKLGAEIGKAAGTNVRHRFFGVIDRTQMVIARNIIQSQAGPTGTVVATINNPAPPPATIPAPLNPPGLQWVQIDLSNPTTRYNYNANPAQNVIFGTTPTASGGNVAWNITPGTILVVDRGTRNEEWIQVLNISPTPNWPANPPPLPNPQLTAYIQAVFLRSHGYDVNNGYVGGFTITQPGNPGPQPPIDVRDYQHAPVVPVSVNLNN